MMQSVSPDFVTLCIKLLSLVSLRGVNELVRAKRFCFYLHTQYSKSKIRSAYIFIFSYLNIDNCFIILQGNIQFLLLSGNLQESLCQIVYLVIFQRRVFYNRVSVLFGGIIKSSHGSCSIKKAILEISQNSQGNTCTRASFLIKQQASCRHKACNFIKKESLAQVFSCEFCKII